MKKRNADIKVIKPYLRKLFTAENVDFFRNHEHSLSKLKGEMEGRASFQTLEDMLLDALEFDEGGTKVRARIISYYFNFPEKCLHMIRERRAGNIAIGCRKAGLYQYGEAVPDIVKALDIFSSEIQLQALMALARIGDAGAMVQAFDKIFRLILVNERAVHEVLSSFSGDRFVLYKNMIHHQSEYLVRLFIKSIDPDIAARLIDDIVLVSEHGRKEMRLAGIIAIGKSGSRKKIPILIEAMEDPEWEIRAMAAKTLGILTSPGAIRPLAKAARDSEWWVRQNAVTAILSYPSRDRILAAIAGTGDKYAYDSMFYALGKASETKLLSMIVEVWSEKTKRANLAESAVKAK